MKTTGGRTPPELVSVSAPLFLSRFFIINRTLARQRRNVIAGCTHIRAHVYMKQMEYGLFPKAQLSGNIKSTADK